MVRQDIYGIPVRVRLAANGNLTGDGSSTYLYDVENRLVSAGGGSSANLRYDPLGRLYETSGGAAGITRVLYDGDTLVAEYSAAKFEKRFGLFVFQDALNNTRATITAQLDNET